MNFDQFERLHAIGLTAALAQQFADFETDPDAQPMRVLEVHREHLLLHDGADERRGRPTPRLLDQLRDGGVNPHLELLGVVMTMFDGRTRLSQQVVAEVRQHFGDRVFETLIPRTTRLAEAPSFGKPIIHYDPYSVASAAYDVLCGEVLKRLRLA